MEIPLLQTSSDSDLLRSIVQEIVSSARRKKIELGSWTRLIDRLEPVHVGVLGSGVEVARRHPVEERTALTLWREYLEAIREAPVLTVCIDDADRLTAAGVGTLKTIAEAQTPLRVILVVAGGLELTRRLATHEFSPVARVFSGAMLDREAFTEEETRETLEPPLRGEPDAGSWTAEGVRRVHQLSHGYPYLVKCVAHATYRPRAVLDAGDVESAVPRTLEIAAPWLDREIPEASDGDIRAFVRIARFKKTHLTASEIGSLGVTSVYTKRLVKLEVLRHVAPGRYELRKAPAIAYYHEKRRHLERARFGPPQERTTKPSSSAASRTPPGLREPAPVGLTGTRTDAPAGVSFYARRCGRRAAPSRGPSMAARPRRPAWPPPGGWGRPQGTASWWRCFRAAGSLGPFGTPRRGPTPASGGGPAPRGSPPIAAACGWRAGP